MNESRFITPLSFGSVGSIGRAIGASYSSGAFPSSNMAIYIPFTISRPVLVKKMFAANGASAVNNIDLGLYDVSGVRIVSTGSVGRSGTTTIEAFDITDTMIGPGNFYIAVAMNGTTGALQRWAATVPQLQHMGIFTQASAFALPAVATFATPAQAYLPLVGLSVVTNVG